MNKNLIFLKLMAFFVIIAVLCFGLFYFLDMNIMFYVAEGSIIFAVITLVALLFKVLFMKDIDKNIKEISENNNIANGTPSNNWVCQNCNSQNPYEAKFCNNCGAQHNSEG